MHDEDSVYLGHRVNAFLSFTLPNIALIVLTITTLGVSIGTLVQLGDVNDHSHPTNQDISPIPLPPIRRKEYDISGHGQCDWERDGSVLISHWHSVVWAVSPSLVTDTTDRRYLDFNRKNGVVFQNSDVFLINVNSGLEAGPVSSTIDMTLVSPQTSQLSSGPCYFMVDSTFSLHACIGVAKEYYRMSAPCDASEMISWEVTKGYSGLYNSCGGSQKSQYTNLEKAIQTGGVCGAN